MLDGNSNMKKKKTEPHKKEIENGDKIGGE